MQKTRMGVSVGMMGAAMFLTCFFGGYVAMLLLAGYILLFEENPWLKRSTVKGVVLAFAFTLLSGLVTLIPNAIGFINSVAVIFEETFYITVVSNIVNMIVNALDLVEKVLFLVLAFKALSQSTIKLPVIDAALDKHMA